MPKARGPQAGHEIRDGKRIGFVVRVAKGRAFVKWKSGKPAFSYVALGELSSARSNPSLAAARDEYENKHWGIPAKGAKEVTAPRVKGNLIEMGTLKGVMYETEKKGDGPSVYVHEFEGKRPRLAFDQSKKKRLYIVGGSYDVKDRGIIG